MDVPTINANEGAEMVIEPQMGRNLLRRLSADLGQPEILRCDVNSYGQLLLRRLSCSV